MKLPKTPQDLVNYSDADLIALKAHCLRSDSGDVRKYLGWIEHEESLRLAGADIVGLGAELWPAFIPHLGNNTAMAHALYPNKLPVNFQKAIGGPLTEELWNMITKQAGCNRIAVMWHKPDFELTLTDAFRRCVVTLSADDPGSKMPIGHVIQVYQNKWMKGELWYNR